MSTIDQQLVRAFEKANGARFAAAKVVDQSPAEHAAEAVAVAEPTPLENPTVAVADDTRSMIGLLNRQAAGIEAGEQPSATQSQSGLSVTAEEKWQPALEVDHFAWPPIVDTVLERAGKMLGQLSERLTQAARNRTQLIAVVGDRPESGATTMTLSLARLFAANQLSVALVDLDESNPQLAQALGVRPMISWLAMLDEGVALEEVLIESVKDQVTLSPLCQPSETAINVNGASLAQQFWLPLSSHFDVILADCGTAGRNDRLANVLSAAGVSELIVVADNRCDVGTVAEIARPLLEQVNPVHWSVIRNFSA